MPLDGSELFANPTLAKLWEVECLLATEDQWCKGRLHDRKGRHCLVGAMSEVNARQELTRPIIRAIKEISGKHYWRIESYNDDPSTDHQDILRILYRARLFIIEDISRTGESKPWYAKVRDLWNEMFSIGTSGSAFDSAAEGAVAITPKINEAVYLEEESKPRSETVDISL